jgi:hypothetical protein
MKDDVKVQGVEKASCGTNNIEPPPAPVLAGPTILLSQLPNRLVCLNLGRLKISDLNAGIIQDGLLTVHKVKKSAHLRNALEEVSRSFSLEIGSQHHKDDGSHSFLIAYASAWELWGSASVGRRSSRETQPISGGGHGTR